MLSQQSSGCDFQPPGRGCLVHRFSCTFNPVCDKGNLRAAWADGTKATFQEPQRTTGHVTHISTVLYKISSRTFAVIDIPLQKNVQPPAITAKQKTSLGNWDKRREEQLGKEGGLWDVVYCVRGTFRPSISGIRPMCCFLPALLQCRSSILPVT